MHTLALKMNYNIMCLQYIAKLQKRYWDWSLLFPNNILIKNRKNYGKLLQEYDSIIVTTRIILT